MSKIENIKHVDDAELLALRSEGKLATEPQKSVDVVIENPQLPTEKTHDLTDWENKSESSFLSNEELDFKIPVKTQPMTSKKRTTEEFREIFKNIINLPSISEITLSEVSARGLVSQYTGASEEQSEEGSYSYTTTETENYLDSEDDQLLRTIQEIDTRNEELEQVTARSTASTKQMNAFMDIASKPPVDDVTQFLVEKKYEEGYVKTKNLISEFLNLLIERVVRIVNSDDPEAILRKSLDKNKLLKKLIELVIASHKEQRVNKLLNKKIVDHFRHKRSFSYLSQTYEEISTVEIEKCRENMENLDHLLGYQKSMLENKMNIEGNLKVKINIRFKEAHKEIDNFEELVRSSLTRPESSERYVTAINALLSKLAKARYDVTEYRRDLIFRQSTIAQMKMEFERLEYIDVGLNMNDYNVLLTKTIGLSKLVEDKDYQIQVHRKRCHETLHTVTHILENVRMEKAMLKIHEEKLEDIDAERQNLKEELYRSKIKHLKMLQGRSQINQHGGLLGKQAILLGYDKILEQIPQVQKRIENLKETYENLVVKIDNLTQLYENSRIN